MLNVCDQMGATASVIDECQRH